MQRIAVLCQNYSYEHGIDLFEAIAMRDVGDTYCPRQLHQSRFGLPAGLRRLPDSSCEEGRKLWLS